MHFLSGGMLASLFTAVICFISGTLTGWYPVLTVFSGIVFSGLMGLIKELIDSRLLKDNALFCKKDILLTVYGGLFTGIIMIIALCL